MFDTHDGWNGIDDARPKAGQEVVVKTLLGREAIATYYENPSPHWDCFGARQLECFPYWRASTGGERSDG